MDENFVFAIILGLIFAALFFIEDYYDDNHNFQIHSSLIAGISISYFFIILLPEISDGLPNFTISNLEYLFILLGFCFIHVSEKLILQKVESSSQRRVRKMLKKEALLKTVEHSIENIINNEIQQENLDELALKDMVRILNDLHLQGKKMMESINHIKLKIEEHIKKELGELRFLTDFVYHFLVGFIIYNLLLLEPFAGVLFFIFAFFRAVINKRSEKVEVPFSDLDIKIKFEESKLIQLLIAISPMIGVTIGLLCNFVIPYTEIYLEVIFVLYSFISGVILYVIVCEVISKKDKGNPIYFVIGLTAFTLIIIIIKIVQFSLGH